MHLKKWSKAIGSLSEVLEIQSFVLGDSHPSTHRTSKRIEDLNSKINKMEESVAEAFLVHDFVNATPNAASSNNSNVSLLNDPPQNPKTVLEWMQKAHYLVYADMQQAKWIECRQCLEIVSVFFNRIFVYFVTAYISTLVLLHEGRKYAKRTKAI